MTETTILYFNQLPFYLTVRKITDYAQNRVRVEIESTVHKNKIVKMPTEFSLGFCQAYGSQFMGDVLLFIIKTYGLKKRADRYE